jgi:Protein of unknown function (Porph_ging).
MKTVFNTFLFSMCVFALTAQIPQGHITYNRKTDYISIMSKLPYISQEDVDRMSLTWGNWNSDGEDYDLYFENQKTLYTKAAQESEGGRSWKKDKLILMRDYRSNSQEDLIETLGKVYHLKEDISKTKWKILNEIKEVAGYLCMKAETKNVVKGQTIHAWFTDAIPFSGGPEGYGGLPGMIMEININENDAVITATNVNLEEAELKIPYPKKIKGKKIAKSDYDSMVKKYIDEMIEGKKNPYWRVRY